MVMRMMAAITLLALATATYGDDRFPRPPRGLLGTKDARFYDSGGRLLGRVETRGGIQRFYDSGGRFRGRSETRGRETRYYSPGGRFLGRGRRP